MLSDRCLSVWKLVYCGQTVGWIKMKLGYGHTVLDGDPAPPKGGQRNRFFTVLRSYASVVLGVIILSVCHTRALWLIQRTYRRYFYTTWKGNPSSFLLPNTGWWATSCSTFNWRSKWRTPFKNRSRRQISACNICTVRANEESSSMMNRKSYAGFPKI